jgi:flagellar biosynthesis/type III secretory pathway chaperone
VVDKLDRLLKDFIETMGKINRTLDSLADLGQEKKQFIILGQVKELDKLIQREGIIVSNLEKLEGARFKYQQNLASKWDMTASELSASMILKKVRKEYPAYHEEMNQEIQRLEFNVVRLKALNDGNNELINQSLEYINVMQSVLLGDGAGTYSESGQRINEPPSRHKINLLDKKA